MASAMLSWFNLVLTNWLHYKEAIMDEWRGERGPRLWGSSRRPFLLFFLIKFVCFNGRVNYIGVEKANI